MLIEAQRVEPGTRVEANVCIVGTGPAGLTLLRQLSGHGMRVVALESGGRTFDAEAQSLCDGAVLSKNYPGGALMSSRRRQLGGTAHLWNDELDAGQGHDLLRLVALDPIDFEKRDWVRHSGWPFSKAELDRFYDKALALTGAVSPGDFDRAAERHSQSLLPDGRVRTVFSRFADRTLFTRDMPAAVSGDKDVSVYLNATLLELIRTGDMVSHARVGFAPGREFEVSADFFVLAAGGIENARVLLLSDRNQRGGLGNENDLVGRFFMDHPSFRLGLLTPSDQNLFRSTGLYDHHVLNGQKRMGKITFSEQTMRREKMLNIGATLTPRGRDYQSAAVKAIKEIIRSSSPRSAIRSLRLNFRTVASHWDELAARCYSKLTKSELIYFENKGGWSRLTKPERRFRKFEVCCLAEQSPNPANRVSLADAVDRFGQRKTTLHWQWSDLDLQSIRRAQDILKEELESHELGKFVRQYELDDGEPPFVCTPHHHIGTTRMHADPRQGVVDADGRVHGISNLYVTGSSVFPTGGFANPTLTIIALAIRLADYLKELTKLAPSPLARSATSVPTAT